MKYFVSVEQIQANITFYMQKIFTTERNVALNEQGTAARPEYFATSDSWKVNWTPVIWGVEELDITAEDCMRNVALLPVHKKLRVIEGPLSVMGDVLFDDGTEVFDELYQARMYVIDYIANNIARFNEIFSRALSESQRL